MKTHTKIFKKIHVFFKILVWLFNFTCWSFQIFFYFLWNFNEKPSKTQPSNQFFQHLCHLCIVKTVDAWKIGSLATFHAANLQLSMDMRMSIITVLMLGKQAELVLNQYQLQSFRSTSCLLADLRTATVLMT